MADIFTGADVQFMIDTLAQIGSWVERGVTVYSFSSVGSSGTMAEAGDPQEVTFGTRFTTARLDNLDFKTVERSSGVYQADDRKVTIRGTFAKEDMIGFSTGTYKPINGPYQIFVGSSLCYQAVCRKVQS